MQAEPCVAYAFSFVDADLDTCTISADCVGVDFCDNVVCRSLSQCHVAGTCAHGLCSPSLPKTAGTSCDDGHEETDFDECDGNGICAGVNLCFDVKCPTPNQCQLPVACSHGLCPALPSRTGDDCNDDDDGTDDDKCTASAVCTGIDYCVARNVECPVADQCHAGVQCRNGVCPPLPALVDGTLCDDGDAGTGTQRIRTRKDTDS